jgi:Nitroreductase family
MAEKEASSHYPIYELLAERRSPYAFDDRQILEADLRSLFEAARWAPSSYNEQPWSYILATEEDPDQFCQGFLKKGPLRCSKNPHPVVMPSARAQVFSVTQPSAFPGAETSRP